MQREELVKELIKKKLSLSVFTKEMQANGVNVVQPGTFVTTVFRPSMNRFFPETDDMDIVVGGYYG